MCVCVWKVEISSFSVVAAVVVLLLCRHYNEGKSRTNHRWHGRRGISIHSITFMSVCCLWFDCGNSNNIIKVHIKWACAMSCMYNEKWVDERCKSRKAKGLQNSIRLYKIHSNMRVAHVYQIQNRHVLYRAVWCAVSYFVSNIFLFLLLLLLLLYFSFPFSRYS